MTKIKTIIGAKQLQHFLKKEHRYDGAIDGILGRKSIHGAMGFLQEYGLSMTSSWSPERVFIAIAQVLFTDLKLSPGTVDGLMGPNTDRALEAYQNLMVGSCATHEEREAQTNTTWPTYSRMERFYGPVGQNIERFKLPYTMRLAWDQETTVNKMSLHRLCGESAIGVMEDARDHYGIDGIRELRLDQFGGSLNVRKMRGGNDWSVHSWAAAIDFDPMRNQFRWNHTRATLDESVYDFWWALWEKQGWVSLGRERNFDWMHVQAVRL